MSKKLNQIAAIVLSTTLIFQQAGFAQVAAQLDLSSHFAKIGTCMVVDKFRPMHLRYLQYLPQDNSFKLLLDKGTQPNNPITQVTTDLMKYFYIGLTLPNDAFWVNLRPDSPDNIIDQDLAKTDLGKILLEADLQLKKDTAQFTSPQSIEGKEYWNKLYKKAEELFGTDQITIPTLTRPWIVPGEIIVRETTDSAYIYKATLKVLLEEDYLKTQVSSLRTLAGGEAISKDYSFNDRRLKELNKYSTELIKELIIPKLTKEINSSKRYASLRQVYYSLIMAQWFKLRFKLIVKPNNPSNSSNPITQVTDLIDSRNLSNLISKQSWSKDTYFQAYKKSFAQGEYNLKEQVYGATGQTMRSYVSGGMVLDASSAIIQAESTARPGFTFPGAAAMPIIGQNLTSEITVPAYLGITPVSFSLIASLRQDPSSESHVASSSLISEARFKQLLDGFSGTRLEQEIDLLNRLPDDLKYFSESASFLLDDAREIKAFSITGALSQKAIREYVVALKFIQRILKQGIDPDFKKAFIIKPLFEAGIFDEQIIGAIRQKLNLESIAQRLIEADSDSDQRSQIGYLKDLFEAGVLDTAMIKKIKNKVFAAKPDFVRHLHSCNSLGYLVEIGIIDSIDEKTLGKIIVDLSDSDDGDLLIRLYAAEAIRALHKAGAIDEKTIGRIREKISVALFAKIFSEPIKLFFQFNPPMITALFEAGILDINMLKTIRNQALENLKQELSIKNPRSNYIDTERRKLAVLSIKALFPEGVSEKLKEVIIKALSLPDFIQDLSEENSVRQRETVLTAIALIEMGVLDGEIISKNVTLTGLIKNLRDEYIITRQAAAQTVDALAEVGFLGKGADRRGAIPLGAAENPVLEQFHRYYLRLAKELEYYSNVKLIPKYLDAGLMAFMNRWEDNKPRQDFYYKQLARIIREGKLDAVEARALFERPFTDKFRSFFSRLRQKLGDDADTEERIFNYLDDGLLALESEIADEPTRERFFEELAKIIREGKFNAAEARAALAGELALDLNYGEPMRSWQDLNSWLDHLERPSLSSRRILAHIIVTMRLLQHGLGLVDTFVNRSDVENNLPFIRRKVGTILGRINDRLARKRMVKAIGLGNRDQINTLREQAVILLEEATGTRNSWDGLEGGIRNNIHNFPSPENLFLVRAYRNWVMNGDRVGIGQYGFNVYGPCTYSQQRKTRVLQAANNLIATLEDVYGEGSITNLNDYFVDWRRRVEGNQTLKNEISNLLAGASENTMAYLDKIVQVRRDLADLERNLSEETLFLTIGLDNRLEVFYYRKFNEISAGIDYSQFSTQGRVVINLLENASLNGYAREEAMIMVRELRQLVENQRPVRQDWLRLYAVYKRIERLINNASRETVGEFQEMAERVASRIGVGDDVWVKNFSSNMFRSDTIYLLSLALKKAKEAVMQEAKISGWQVVVPGNTEGRLRFINDAKRIGEARSDEIIVVDHLPPESAPMNKLRGIITLTEDSLLSHPAIRARQFNILFVVCPDAASLRDLDGQWVSLRTEGDDVLLAREEIQAGNDSLLQKEQPKKIDVIPVNLGNSNFIVLPQDYRSERVGNKAYGLSQVPSELMSNQIATKHLAISFGFMPHILNLDINSQIKADITKLSNKLLEQGGNAQDLQLMRKLIESLKIPDVEMEEILNSVRAVFGDEVRRLFLRSSTDAEDLVGYAGAGLYDSFGNVRFTKDDLAIYIKKIWASVWNDRAFLDREENGIDHSQVFAAVLIQEIINPDYAFVIHTQNPVKPGNEVVMEFVQGFGESLVSGDPEFEGSPYRVIYNRESSQLDSVRFANKSKKLVIAANGRMEKTYADYSSDSLFTSKAGREFLREIAEASLLIEEGFNDAQDIEGVVLLINGEWKVVFLQARSQNQIVSSSIGNDSVAKSQVSSSPVGGIDFRSLPIVIQASSALRLSMIGAPLGKLDYVSLSRESEAIQKMVEAGITPSEERIKDFVQASSALEAGNFSEARQKAVSWIAEILRCEEEDCCASSPILKDMLVILDSGVLEKELKAIFTGSG
jgi:phosphohistidine swiveling domain-containing protein